MNIVRILTVTLALTGALATAAMAQAGDLAQRSNTSGGNFGVFLSGSSVTVGEGDAGEFGSGMGFQLGYGFTPHVSVFARASVGKADVAGASSGVTHADLGLRYSFGGTSSALRPFVLGALNGRIALEEGILGEAYARGIGFTGGGGLEYFVSPTVSIDAVLLHSFGVSNQLRGEDDDWGGTPLNANSTRIEIGISLHQ